MKRLKWVCLALLLIPSIGRIFPEQNQAQNILPGDFGDRAMNHVIYLAGMGHRQAGSENDEMTVQYLKQQFKGMGLEVEIQGFELESFEYTNLLFEVNDIPLKVTGLGFNPYENKRAYKGSALLLDSGDVQKTLAEQVIEGKTIITNDWASHFVLIRFMPQLIIYIDPSDFERLQSQENLIYRLTIDGEYRKFPSANVVATLGDTLSFPKEILITAHSDTYRTNNPGASDNASGVGVLLELARYFKGIEHELTCAVKFVAFGAEEVGVAGSRHYLDRNTESLQRCELLFNLDDVGGQGTPAVEAEGGVRGISEKKCVSFMPEEIKTKTWEGVDSYWRMLPGDDLLKILGASNHPEWLADVLQEFVEGLGYEVRFQGTMGSDQITFAHAGIVTSGVGITSPFSHTPQDTAASINVESLKKAGEIAARAVLNTMKRLRKRP